MTPFPFWNKEKKKDEELLKESFCIRLTKQEMDFVVERHKIECNSINGIIRKAINQYRNSITSK